jgi:hypothetical protein
MDVMMTSWRTAWAGGTVARATLGVFAVAASLAAGLLPVAPRLALLPMAVVFGWSQIGGV